MKCFVYDLKLSIRKLQQYVTMSLNMDMNLIDKDTVTKTVLSHHDKRIHHLVMSDEYNTEGRDFGVGQDKIFEVICIDFDFLEYTVMNCAFMNRLLKNQIIPIKLYNFIIHRNRT